jgi:hypothetical protein
MHADRGTSTAGAKCVISIRSTVDISVWTVPDAKGSIVSMPYVADNMKQVRESAIEPMPAGS